MVSKPKLAALPIARLNDILLPLRDAFRKLCVRRDLGMSRVGQTAASRYLYALTGEGTINAQTDRTCMLNQLFPKTHPELWIGVLIELRKRAGYDDYELFHVSVQAFQGATSQTLQSLLRAEWDPAVSRERKGPAQPHWHAYSLERQQASRAGATFEQFVAPPTMWQLQAQQWQHRMHFALCANWHKGGSHYEPLNSVDEMKEWLVGVVSYVRAQVSP